MNVLPLMKSHYSVGKSILTLEAPHLPLNETFPVSIFDIAAKHKLSEVILVDDFISGFLEAHQNAEKVKVKLIYGIQIRCMENIETKNEASLKTISKIIIFIKNTNGYKDLIKITSCAAKEGFYYKPNIDFIHLKELWTPNLILAIPFYDSFLFRNSLEGYLCVPNFSFTQPVFFLENSNLPFDKFIQGKVKKYAKSIRAPVLLARSIYYYKNSDFLSYLTFRCIHERTTMEKPELEHCSSNWFSFEKWEEQEKNPETINLL